MYAPVVAAAGTGGFLFGVREAILEVGDALIDSSDGDGAAAGGAGDMRRGERGAELDRSTAGAAEGFPAIGIRAMELEHTGGRKHRRSDTGDDGRNRTGSSG